MKRTWMLLLSVFPIFAAATTPSSMVQSFDFGEIAKDRPWLGEWTRVPHFPEVPTVNARIVLPYGKKDVKRLEQIRGPEPPGARIVVAAADLLVRQGCPDLALDQGTDSGHVSRICTHGKGQPVGPLQQERAHGQGLPRLQSRFFKRWCRVVLRLARDIGFGDDGVVDGDLHHTAPLPRLRLRRTIW